VVGGRWIHLFGRDPSVIQCFTAFQRVQRAGAFEELGRTHRILCETLSSVEQFREMVTSQPKTLITRFLIQPCGLFGGFE
jgi:hypothetical protein